MEELRTKEIEIEEKREIKRHVNKVMRGVFLYSLIMLSVVIIDAVIRLVEIYVKYGLSENIDARIDKVASQISESGVSSIVAIVVGIFFLCFYFRKQEYTETIYQSNRKMSSLGFFMIVLVFMSSQALFQLFGMGVEAGLNHFGYSILGEIQSASATSTTWSMFFYVSLIGPIAEELVFRGFVLRGFERFGKHLAIIVSAIVFGAFHGNLIQGVFATMVGLVLGYVAMEYSIVWSMLLHIINNFVFGDLWAFLTSGLSDTVQNILLYSVEGTFFVGGILVLVLNRRNVLSYLQQNRIDKKYAKIMMTAGWMLLFLGIQLLLGLVGIEKI